MAGEEHERADRRGREHVQDKRGAVVLLSAAGDRGGEGGAGHLDGVLQFRAARGATYDYFLLLLLDL